MLQIGFLEILIILLVGIIVIGPEKLPEFIKSIMKIIGLVFNTLMKMENLQTLNIELLTNSLDNQLTPNQSFTTMTKSAKKKQLYSLKARWMFYL